MIDSTTSTDLHTTIMLVTDNRTVLLAMKKRGFGVGKWNGPGGKLEPGESPLDGAVRECKEEVGITPLNPTERATLRFELGSLKQTILCHVFLATRCKGTPVETEEMRPQQFAFADIPYDTMWQDDIYWLPAVLAGRKLEGTFEFDTNDTLISFTVRETQ